MEEGGVGAVGGGDFGGGMDAGAGLGGMDAGGFDSAIGAANDNAMGGLDTGGLGDPAGLGGFDSPSLGGFDSPSLGSISDPGFSSPSFSDPGLGLSTPGSTLSSSFGPAPGSIDTGIGTIGSPSLDPFSGASAFDLSSPALGLSTPTVDPTAPQDLNALGIGTIGTPIGGDPFANTPIDFAQPQPPTGTDPFTGAVQTGAEALTGYRAGMYGEVGVGPYSFDVGPEAKFGRMAPGSTLANPSFGGYGIDNFATERGWGAPQQTMVSSQATWDYAKQQAAELGLDPRGVTFETTDPLSPNRTYDVRLEPTQPGMPPSTVTEIKAGKSISDLQLGRDITAANAGLPVDYQFAGNPITGNHGPDATGTAKLADANLATNGRLTSGVADVAPTAQEMSALKNVAQVSELAHGLGKVAVPVGIAADAYSIYNGVQQDGGHFGKNATAATAGAAGGWAGAAAGGWGGVQIGTGIGAVVGGPVGAAVGAVAGGLIGAIGGGLLGGWGGESAARAVMN